MRHFYLPILFLTGLLICCFTTASASVGTEAAPFLEIPVGAGPAALGGSYSARATDAYGVAWNPAGLAQIPEWQLAAQHSDYLESIHYEFAGVAVPLRKGSTLGIGVQYLGSGDIPGTANDGTATGNFSNHYAAYSVAFGQSFSDTFSLGLTGKWIEAKLGDVHANAFAADVGALYQPTKRLALALTLMNAGNSLTFLNQSDPLPLSGRAGVLYSVLDHWDISVDGNFPRIGKASAHTGIEWRPIHAISIRAGYRTDTLRELSPLAGVTAGAGLNLFGQEFSYAWTPMGELGNVQYFSMLLKFGRTAEDRKNLVYLGDFNSAHTVWNPRATVRESPMPKENDPDVEQNQLKELLSENDPEFVRTR